VNYEAIIIGGGVVGSSLALILGQGGLDVCLIDKGRPSSTNEHDFYKGRTASLNLSSIGFLKKLGVWEQIEDNTTVFSGIEVWDSQGSSAIKFSASEIEEKKLGVTAFNNLLSKVIYSELSKISNVSIIEDDSLDSIQVREDVLVSTRNGLNLGSNILIGADGSLSSVRNLSSIPIRTWSYDQIAFVASLKPEFPVNNTSYQIFTDTGPIALLPINGKGENLVSLVWSADKEYASKLEKLNTENLLEELKLKTENKLGSFQLRGEITTYPLNQLHVKEYFSDRVALVGDSAHTIHPLAGQGLNLGLSDVNDLSERILVSRRLGLDIGGLKLLQEYSSSRKKVNLKMIALMEAFKRGFGSTNPWLRMGRNMAFSVTDKAKPLKKRFIKEAVGVI